MVIRAGLSGEAFTVTDSRGNTYRKAVQFNETGNGNTLGIFYAENIASGANTITVTDTAAGTLRFAILEYSGIATVNSLDVSVAAQGRSTAASSGTVTTAASGDLLLGAILTANPANYAAGSNYKIEENVPVQPNTKLMVEDQVGGAAGVASSSATLSATDNWAAGLAAFRVAGVGGGTVPSLTTLSPTSGPAGTSVTISGSNFGTTQGSSAVAFNGMPATPTSWTATSIVAPVPAGATTGNVMVSVAGLSSNGMTFSVLLTPSITTLSPTSGPVGTSVTISGSNFGITQGSSAVAFNGMPAAPTSWSATSIVAPVPAGTTTGNVMVSLAGLSSNGVIFSVLPVNAAISLVQHASKDAGTASSSSLAFPSANLAGNWIGVVIRAGLSGEAFTVTDSRGNTYRKAVQFNETGNGNTLGIFYAENIASGANTITVTDTAASTLRYAILEYSGLATANSLDVTASRARKEYGPPAVVP